MTKATFLEGMGLGVLAGTAIGIAVAAKRPDTMCEIRRAARRAARRVDRIKDDLSDSLDL